MRCGCRYCSNNRAIRHPVGMARSAQLCIGAGGLGLLLVVVNQITAAAIDPALQRSSALAALLAVGLMLVGVLWTRVLPVPPERADLQGEEGLLLRSGLAAPLAAELDWGSRMLLTATPAAVVLVLWQQEVLLQRGLLVRRSGPGFRPGPICEQVLQRGRSIHLVDLRHYPGRDEFTTLLDGLPSVVVEPLGSHGVVLVGGWSPRCFSRADQRWISGWAERLRAQADQQGAVEPLAASASSAPASPEH